MKRRTTVSEWQAALEAERKRSENRSLRTRRATRGSFAEQKLRHAKRQHHFDAVVEAGRKLADGTLSVLRVDGVLVETSREETNEAVIRVRGGYMLVDFYDGQHAYMNPVSRSTNLVNRQRFAFQKDRLVFYVRRAA